MLKTTHGQHQSNALTVLRQWLFPLHSIAEHVMGYREYPFGQLGSALLTDQISLSLTVNLLPTSASSLGQQNEKQGWP